MLWSRQYGERVVAVAVWKYARVISSVQHDPDAVDMLGTGWAEQSRHVAVLTGQIVFPAAELTVELTILLLP